jgi:myo-inositol-1-phosphate synthase
VNGGNMSTVNVGVIGIGNCASSLVQGVEYYAHPAGGRAGLTNAVCGGYAVSDITFTSAFDVNVSKIDRDLSEAIWAAPNNALRFAEVPRVGVPVREGILSDGIGRSCADRIEARGRATVDTVAAHLTRASSAPRSCTMRSWTCCRETAFSSATHTRSSAAATWISSTCKTPTA